jgi:nucleoporin GLE1
LPIPGIRRIPAPQPYSFAYNIFSKAVISQLIAEAGIRVKYAEPIGILAAQVFSSER